MSAISSFHTKAKAESQAKTESAKGERERADRFLSQLDEILSEGFNEVTEVAG
jgi:hypothetical protein